MADEEEFQDCIEGPIRFDGTGKEALDEGEEEVSMRREENHVFQKVEETVKKNEIDEGKEEVNLHSSSLQEQNKEKSEVEEWGEKLEDALILEKDINKALEAKEEGNKFFRLKDYDTSIQHYSEAISYCPETPEYAEQLATFYGNRSAAYFAEEEYELVIEDCTEALNRKQDYTKVLVRRMQCYDKLEKFEEALEDAKKIKELDPSYPKIDQTINRLQKLHDEKMNKMKDEALGKLKELGNTILGNFGLSLDNFKMVQDPNTGGWSISMGNNN